MPYQQLGLNPVGKFLVLDEHTKGKYQMIGWCGAMLIVLNAQQFMAGREGLIPFLLSVMAEQFLGLVFLKWFKSSQFQLSPFYLCSSSLSLTRIKLYMNLCWMDGYWQIF